jgi:hypothetical protein
MPCISQSTHRIAQTAVDHRTRTNPTSPELLSASRHRNCRNAEKNRRRRMKDEAREKRKKE